MDFLRNLDAYPKLKAEYTTRTAHGACSSIVAILIMTYLFVSEFMYYSSVEVVDRLSVNSTHAQRIVMRFDIVFPHIPCDLLSLDAMDSSGQRQEGVVTHIYKKTIDPITLKKTGDKVKVKELGTLQHEHELGDIDKSESKDAGKDDAKSKCGNCYGAQEKPEDCCNTCEEVRDAYRKKGWAFRPEIVEQCNDEAVISLLSAGKSGRSSSGCEVSGDIDLTTVNGNVHFAPGASVTNGARTGQMSVAQLMQFTFETFNITHEIKHLSFGNHFPGIMNPLDGEKRVVQDGHGMYQYYLKVVPTIYKYLNGRSIESNQFSVTEHLRHITIGSGRGLPGVWFFYELSPIHATFEEKKRSTFLEFTASICAILGGIFTIFGVIDSGIDWIIKKLSPSELGR